MRLRQHRQVRRGVELTEFAIVSFVFVLLLLGMIDLGIGVFRNNTISQAARHGVRAAIVHGELAASDWRGGIWGTSPIDVLATDATSPQVGAIRPMLIGCNMADTRIRVEWIDAGNKVGQRVRVTVSTTYRPLLSFVGTQTINLSSSSTMPIAH